MKNPTTTLSLVLALASLLAVSQADTRSLPNLDARDALALKPSGDKKGGEGDDKDGGDDEKDEEEYRALASRAALARMKPGA